MLLTIHITAFLPHHAAAGVNRNSCLFIAFIKFLFRYLYFLKSKGT